MPYGETDLTQVMGIGSYVGEVREAPDGQLYEWVEGVDGLGNPIGFWKKLWRGIKRVGSGLVRALPGALKFASFIPGVGPALSLARGALRAASPLLRRALPFARYLPYGAALYAGGRLAQRAGLFGVGEVAEGPDGQLYEVVEGVGEFGEPQRRLRRVWLSIPAVIRRRGRMAGAGPGVVRSRRVPVPPAGMVR